MPELHESPLSRAPLAPLPHAHAAPAGSRTLWQRLKALCGRHRPTSAEPAAAKFHRRIVFFDLP